ncbi:MAG: hypothetical protein JWN98_552 [Abditibacteriota bacterium]|nr:hypothetical protein [Abditibacteriota bacterium]
MMNTHSRLLCLFTAVLLLTLGAIPASSAPVASKALPNTPTPDPAIAARAFSSADFWRQQTEVALDVTVLQRRTEGGISWHSMVYTSELYRGAPMRIFAFYAYPTAAGRHPAIVDIHGGGGNANLARAKDFARAGYACLSFDWNTWGDPLVTWAPGAPLPTQPYSIYANLDYQPADGATRRIPTVGVEPDNDDNPTVSGERSEQTAMDGSAGEAWGMQFFELGPDTKRPILYRAIMAARRALSWLEQQPEINSAQLGVVGHSWGGFLAQLLAGIDPRIKAVLSSAASGGWAERYVAGKAMHLQRLSPQQMRVWCLRYDPAAYIDQIKAPLLLRLATSDFFGSIDSVSTYWPRVTAPKVLQLSPSDNHFALNDVTTAVAWLNRCFKGQTGFVESSRIMVRATVDQGVVKVHVEGAGAGTGASVSWTTAPGAWDTRAWAQRAMVPLQNTTTLKRAGQIKTSTLQQTQPSTRTDLDEPRTWTGAIHPVWAGGPLRVFVSIRDAAGNVSSSLPIVHPSPASARPQTAQVSLATQARPITMQNVPVSISHTTLSPLQKPEVWQNIAVLGPIARGAEVVGEQSMHVQTSWDEQAFYLRVRVDDLSPWQTVSRGVPWWNGDSLHLRLRTEERAAEPDVPEWEQRISHLAWYPELQGEGTSAFVARGKFLTQIVRDVTPMTTSVRRLEHGYEFTARLPWKFLDPEFEPDANRSIRFALLAAHGDVLLPEVAGGPILNQAHQLYAPDAWGIATLTGRAQ